MSYLQTTDSRGILAHDPEQYTDYYIDPPSKEEYERLLQARLPAHVDSLEKGITLVWSGPNRQPDSLPPTDYPLEAPEPTPHESRPLLAPLLSPVAPAHGGKRWSLELFEPLQTGEDQWSQVWRCKILDAAGQNVAGSVVLKLYQQLLFPLPEGFTSVPAYDDWNWYPATYLEEREAQAFHLLKRHQGRDVPLCYGFYRFCVPCGADVVGAIFEDLVADTVSLFRLIEKDDYHHRFNMEGIDALACAAFDAQRRLQNCHLLNTCFDLNNVRVINGSYPAGPLLVVLGFTRTQHLRQAEQIEELRERYRLSRGGWRAAQAPKLWVWREDDQQRLDHLLRINITDSPVRYKDWIAMELERKPRRLPYFHIAH